MDHNDIRHKLSEYIDDAVTPQERVEIDEHLKTCTTCSDALAELRRTIDAVKQIEEVAAPAWMTQRIMAHVREEQEKRSGIRKILLHYFTVGRAMRVAAVLFLTVTAYYLSISMNPAVRNGEAPVSGIAKQEAPSQAHDTAKRKAAGEPAEAETNAGRDRGYRSLDMKYSYEKPAPPVPSAAPSAPAPAPAQHEATGPVREEMAREQRAVPPQPRAAAPSVMAKQAARPAKTAQPPASVQDISASAGQMADREAEARLAVAERFSRTDLPKKMKKKGLFYTIRNIQDDPPDLQWMKEMAAFRTNPCASRYVVDVDLSGILSKYLYCAEPSRVRLLGVFELRGSTWTETKRP